MIQDKQEQLSVNSKIVNSIIAIIAIVQLFRTAAGGAPGGEAGERRRPGRQARPEAVQQHQRRAPPHLPAPNLNKN